MSTENIVLNKSDTCLQVANRQGKTSGTTVSKHQGFVCCTTTIILTKLTSYTPQGKQEAQTLLESNRDNFHTQPKGCGCEMVMANLGSLGSLK